MQRNVLSKFIEICMETPCWSPSGWAPTWRPETNRNIIHWVFLQKREFISRGTQEHYNNTFSNTWTVEIAKFSKITPFFKQHDSSLGRHVNVASPKKLRNSNVVYHKTKDPLWAKICMNTSFQLPLYIIKVKSQEDQYFYSLNFSDVIEIPSIEIK